MLPPKSLGYSWQKEHLIRVQFAQHSMTMQSILEVDTNTLHFAMLAMGQVLMRIDWDGSVLHESRIEQIPKELTKEQVLSDLQWMFWPVEAINGVLPKKCHFSSTRILQCGSKIILKVEVDSKRTTLHHKVLGYVLEVE